MIPLPPLHILKEALVIAVIYGLANWALQVFPVQIWAQTIHLPATFLTSFLLTMLLWLLLWYSGLKP